MGKLRKGAIVFGLVGVPAVGLAAWFWWLPNMVNERAVSTLSQRLGMETSIENVSMRWNGVVLEDLRLEGEHGGLEVVVSEVGVRGGLVALATDGAQAVEHVQLRGAGVAIDVSHDGGRSLRAVADRFRGQDGRNVAGEGAAVQRVAELVDGRIDVRDQGGLLATGSVEARYDGSELLLSGAEGRLGEAPSDVLQVATWSLRIRERALAEARLEGPSLQVGQDSGQTLNRLKTAINSVGSIVESSEEEEEEGPDEGVPSWMSKLSEGGEIHVASFRATRATEAGERELLHGLNTRVQRSERELHLTGSGEVQGGRTRWDLWLEPGAAKGRGTLEAHQLPFDLLLPFLPELPWWRPEDGRVDAELDMRADTPGRIALEGRAAVEGVGLSSPRIAPSPVPGLGLEVSGKATWVASDRRLEIEEATVRRREAEVHVVGELERTSEHYRTTLTATMPATDCNAVVGAIPAALLADVGDFEWRGRMGGRVQLELDSRDLEATNLRIRVANGCEFMTVPAIADLRRVRAPFIHRVEEPDGTTFEMTAGPGSTNWAPIFTISPFMVQAVVGHEDGGFFSHSGFAVYAIRGSLVRNLREGRYVTGASTITMQLAKNLFLHREKTLARKMQEVVLTWWLESALTKQEILELYLNVIEYGPGVYGIVHAAEHYFGREPHELSPAEAAFLACILPNPKGYHQSWERGALTTRMRNRVERFLRHLHSRSRIDDEALAFALAELEDFRFARPGQAMAGRTVRGSTAPLPWSTGRMEDWGPEEDPFGDPGYEGSDEGSGDNG